ncbi:MAG: hypothetical protein M1831_005024 [Alyxoria varia]|nr:MAG: hypothetical protein M1831_005024 [Alyxoria varia]
MVEVENTATLLVARFLRAHDYPETLDAFLSEATLPPTTGNDIFQTSNKKTRTKNKGLVPGKDNNNQDAASETQKDNQEEREYEVLTIEKVLHEKGMYDMALQLEKSGLDDSDEEKGWKHSAPSNPRTITSLPVSANVLSVTCTPLMGGPAILTSLATRTTHILEARPNASPMPYPLVPNGHTLHADSPALNCVPFSLSTGDGAVGARERRVLLLSTHMSGLITLHDITNVSSYSEGGENRSSSSSGAEPKLLDSRRDHNKFVVRGVVFVDDEDEQDDDIGGSTSRGCWIATAGWDKKIFVYRMDLSSPDYVQAGEKDTEAIQLGEPHTTLELDTNPEDILFHRLTIPYTPNTAQTTTQPPLLILTRRDSSYLHYYGIPPLPTQQRNQTQKTPQELKLLSKQNLAPHSPWTPFTPTSLRPSPRDPTLLAVATSTVPHMKLLIVRMILPTTTTTTATLRSDTTTSAGVAPEHAEDSAARIHANEPPPIVSNTKPETVPTEKASASILVSTNTLAPQSAYSTPVVVWRPGGAGVWVNGDDGVVRGVDVVSGRVVARLGGVGGGGGGGGRGGGGGGRGGSGNADNAGAGREGTQGHEPGSKVRCLWAGTVNMPNASDSYGHGHGHSDTEEDKGEGDTKPKEEEWLISGGFDRKVVVWRPTLA